MAPDEVEPVDPDGLDGLDGPADENEALDDLLAIVRGHVAGGNPLDILGLASATLSMILHPDPPVTVDRELVRDKVIEDVVLRYVDLGTSDSLTYATAVLAGLLANEVLRKRLRARSTAPRPRSRRGSPASTTPSSSAPPSCATCSTTTSGCSPGCASPTTAASPSGSRSTTTPTVP